MKPYRRRYARRLELRLSHSSLGKNVKEILLSELGGSLIFWEVLLIRYRQLLEIHSIGGLPTITDCTIIALSIWKCLRITFGLYEWERVRQLPCRNLSLLVHWLVQGSIPLEDLDWNFNMLGLIHRARHRHEIYWIVVSHLVNTRGYCLEPRRHGLVHRLCVLNVPLDLRVHLENSHRNVKLVNRVWLENVIVIHFIINFLKVVLTMLFFKAGLS